MSAAICDFRGCVFPAIWTYRDINADVPVCQQHAQFLDLERGEFVDPQFPDLMDSSPTITADSFAFDAGLGFSSRPKLWIPSNRRLVTDSRRIQSYVDAAIRRREIARVRENKVPIYSALLGAAIIRQAARWERRRYRQQREDLREQAYFRAALSIIGNRGRLKDLRGARWDGRIERIAYYDMLDKQREEARQRNPARATLCHPDKQHYAKGLCRNCYKKQLPRVRH